MTEKSDKKKYLGIISSFVNLKNGNLQIHKNLIDIISKSFESVYLINDQHLRLLPDLAKRVYFEEYENEDVEIPFKPDNFYLFNPKNSIEFKSFCENKELVLINNIGKHFFDLKTLYLLKKNKVKLIQIMNLGVMKSDYERPLIRYFKNYLMFHFNQTIFKKITVFLSNIKILPKIEIRFLSDKTVLESIFKNKVKKFLYLNKFLYPKEIIEVNSRTYDIFSKEKFELSEDYIVHLDAGLNIRHEKQLRGELSNELVIKHYEKLNKFLKKLSFEFGKKVIITIHPAYDLIEHKKYFSDYEVVKFKTRELISKAFLVTHFDSSAVTDAIFLKKRLMSFESNYMSTNERIHSRYWSTKIGYLHQNIESDYNFDKKNILRELDSNIKNYNDYISKFHIINPGENGAEKIVRIIKDRFF